MISAAETLAIAIQQCKNFTSSSSPNKETIGVINSWLENFMPVSGANFNFHMKCTSICCYGSSISPRKEGERKLVFKTQFEISPELMCFNDFIHREIVRQQQRSVCVYRPMILSGNMRKRERVFRMSLWQNKNHLIASEKMLCSIYSEESEVCRPIG